MLFSPIYRCGTLGSVWSWSHGGAEMKTPVSLSPKCGSQPWRFQNWKVFLLITQEIHRISTAFHRAHGGLHLKVSELGRWARGFTTWCRPLLPPKCWSHAREQSPGVSPGRTEVFLCSSLKGFHCDSARCLDAEWNRQLSCLPQDGTEEDPGLGREVSGVLRKATFPIGGCDG